MTKRTIIVTGASRGLGAATARIVAQVGANVVLMARSGDELNAMAEEIREAGGQALAVVGDVSKAADCQRAVAEAVKEYGQIDAVVNSAGIIGPIAPIADGDPEEWEKNWAINVLGPVMLTQAALPSLRQRKGRVINVSSGAASKAIPGWSAYCVAKAGLDHFTRTLAREEPSLIPLGFRPGVVDTDMQVQIRREGVAGMPGDEHARFLRYHAEGDLLPPEVPGCSLAALAVHAPGEWSGAILAWNDERVLSLVRQFGTMPCTQQGG